MEPPVARPRPHRTPLVRTVGRSRGPKRPSGSRRGQVGAREEKLDALEEVGPLESPSVVTSCTRATALLLCTFESLLKEQLSVRVS